MGKNFLIQKSLILLMLVTGSVCAEQQADKELKPLKTAYTEPFRLRGKNLKKPQDRREEKINMEAAYYFFLVPDPARNDATIEAIILRDPQTGLSWWGCSDMFDRINVIKRGAVRDFERASTYLSDNAIGYVRAGLSEGLAALWISESTEKYPSLDEAVAHALPLLSQAGPQIIDKGCHSLSHAADISPLAPKAFFYNDAAASPPQLVAEVAAVRKDGSGWIVLLTGEGGAKLSVAVDEHYQARPSTLWKQAASHDSTLPIVNGNNKAKLQASLLAFTNNMTDDKKPYVKVLILRDPRTGLTWWGCQESDDLTVDDGALAKYLGRYRVYLSDNTLGVVLLTVVPTALWVRESNTKYPSMPVAKALALKAFADFMPEILEKGSDTLFHEDNIRGRYKFQFSNARGNDIRDEQFDTLFHKTDVSSLIIGEFFYGDSQYDNRKLFAKLTSASKEGEYLRITLSGTHDRKAEVDINSQHDVDKVIFYP
ncbi:hypothetical protein [Methylovulum psychrotolerans]|uniref:Uncharacterized protein n=1 Tax=Methylovulum psychrotolerans TaxID=1704499 RepID=A0A2S5CGM2_9GAMM|nr:hypothetical protein [Methylovulum psychrotolerans]POZ49955.1 hypothetical protein AADEFJLK_04235 [Methylovulum psychrotolerans]